MENIENDYKTHPETAASIRELIRRGADATASAAGLIADHIRYDSPDLAEFDGAVDCYVRAIDALTDVLVGIEAGKTDEELLEAFSRFALWRGFCPPMTRRFFEALKHRDRYAMDKLKSWRAAYES
jgi:hypothetical protein